MVYGNDAVPVATTITGITPSLSFPLYRLELKLTCTVLSVVNKIDSYSILRTVS